MIRRLDTTVGETPDFSRRQPVMDADQETRKKVRRILRDVRQDGWEAVAGYTREFDGVSPLREPLSEQTIHDAWSRLEEATRDALRLARDRIDRYQRSLVDRSTILSDHDGYLGEIIRPYDRVGCYIPGGRFPLPSTVLMTAYVAQVAGVEEIVVCTPPGEKQTPHPVIQATCSLIDNVEVFGVGGVQAIGAMTHGAGDVEPVDLIVGPGNLFVTLAKKEVYGTVEIDMLAGPSEIAVVADPAHSDPAYVAADLLSQAEHDPMSRAYLLTPDDDFADDVEQRLEDQLATFDRREAIEEALDSSALITTDSIEEAIDWVNELAPEHLELHLENPGRWSREIRHAGAIFCGKQTPEPYGDYLAGPNHTLPTGGGARFFSPLSVRTFRKSQSLMKVGEQQGSEAVATAAETIAGVETLPAHKKSMSIRGEETD